MCIEKIEKDGVRRWKIDCLAKQVLHGTWQKIGAHDPLIVFPT